MATISSGSVTFTVAVGETYNVTATGEAYIDIGGGSTQSFRLVAPTLTKTVGNFIVPTPVTIRVVSGSVEYTTDKVFDVQGIFGESGELRALLNGAGGVALPIYGKREYHILNYGDVSHAKRYDTASMTAGSPALTVNGYTFTAEDVGKTVGVFGAGVVSADFNVLANDGVLVGTIVSVAGGVATLSVNATNTVSSAPCVFGFPIDAALSAAIAACDADYQSDGVHGVVVFPAGRWIAVASQGVRTGTSFRGQGRDVSKIYVTKIVADAETPATAAWIRRGSMGLTEVIDNINFSDFAVFGTFYAASSPYGSDMKMIHMNTTSNSSVQRMRIQDNPSTALGYDLSVNCLIADNIILNGGRLAKTTSPQGTAGGSAIGIAVGSEDKELSMIIRNNFIKGRWNSSGTGFGRSGINIEAASNNTMPTTINGAGTYFGGIVISGNIIEGYYNGIVDSGGLGTQIIGNTVRFCTHGIKMGTNGIPVGGMGRDGIIANNIVRDIFGIDSTFYGIGIAVASTSTTRASRARTLVHGNIVLKVTGGYGIQVLGSDTYPVYDASIFGNAVRDCGWQGIRVYGTLFGVDIANNNITSNGRAGVTGKKAPISVDASVKWTGGRLQNNTYSDWQTTPTQDATHTIHGSAVLTGVRINGNTGDLL